GIAGTAESDINPTAAQNVECRHTLCGMQRMVDRRQHDADAEADALGPLADRRQCQVGRAVVRPYRTEMVLRKPHAGETLLLGKRKSARAPHRCAGLRSARSTVWAPGSDRKDSVSSSPPCQLLGWVTPL